MRQNTSGDNKMASQILPGGRYNAINIPPRLLIMNSYHLQEQLLWSPPGFRPSDSTSSRKPKESSRPPVERDRPSRLQLMIRALLEERFNSNSQEPMKCPSTRRPCPRGRHDRGPAEPSTTL